MSSALRVAAAAILAPAWHAVAETAFPTLSEADRTLLPDLVDQFAWTVDDPLIARRNIGALSSSRLPLPETATLFDALH